MTHDPTRKRFFAKLLGFTAAFSLAPRFLAGFARTKSPAAASGAAPAAVTFPVRPESRAVARRAESV